MPPEIARFEALRIDLTIAEAQIRALLRLQARRSPTAFGDVMQALGQEAGRPHLPPRTRAGDGAFAPPPTKSSRTWA